jgi:hypothetical protein
VSAGGEYAAGVAVTPAHCVCARARAAARRFALTASGDTASGRPTKDPGRRRLGPSDPGGQAPGRRSRSGPSLAGWCTSLVTILSPSQIGDPSRDRGSIGNLKLYGDHGFAPKPGPGAAGSSYCGSSGGEYSQSPSRTRGLGASGGDRGRAVEL